MGWWRRVVSGVLCMVCGVWCVVCGVWRVVCGVERGVVRRGWAVGGVLMEGK